MTQYQQTHLMQLVRELETENEELVKQQQKSAIGMAKLSEQLTLLAASFEKQLSALQIQLDSVQKRLNELELQPNR